MSNGRNILKIISVILVFMANVKRKEIMGHIGLVF